MGQAPLQAAGPGGTVRLGRWLSAEGSLWGLCAGVVPTGTDKAEALRTPSLSDGTGGDLSFGNLAFPKRLELSPQPRLGRGTGPAGQEAAAAVPHCPGALGPGNCGWGGDRGDHMLMQTQGQRLVTAPEHTFRMLRHHG